MNRFFLGRLAVFLLFDYMFFCCKQDCCRDEVKGYPEFFSQINFDNRVVEYCENCIREG